MTIRRRPLRRRPLRLTGLLLALAALTAPAVALASPADAASCRQRWGSLSRATTPLTQAAVRGVRTGRHACYDRLVVDLGRGAAPGYTVEYVRAVTTEGQGAVVPLRGGARLQIGVHAPAYDGSGHPTYVPRDPRALTDVRGYRTFRQVAWGGSFEGYTTVGLGVRARLPFRVFTLHAADGSNRLVVDVAHSW